ncbi:MAG: serine/threonine protein kinase [Deltaproteobacteria bacterium]|nr:serine/threonine protein kinase [Deltaproteobacteria bacterium]
MASVREIALTSMLWVKEFQTNIFKKTTIKLLKTKFIRRNKNSVVICLVIWLIAATSGYLILNSNAKRLINDFHQYGLSASQKLAGKIAPSLLENNILSLNVAIGEIDGSNNLISASILNHENKFVTHTDSNMINRTFIPIKDERYIDTIEGVSIKAKSLPNNEKIVSFSTNITFSGINIGKVYLVFSSTHLYSSISKYKAFFLYAIVLSLVLFSAIMAAIDRISKTKALKIQKKLEGMTRIGPYILQKKIAQGGMAELFLADYVREDGFRRIVVVKKILPHLIENSEFIKMFIREARLAALLQHPNIVQINDFGKFRNVYYIAMEYVRGKNLAEITAVAKNGLPVDQSVFLVLQVSRGLHYSHSKTDDKTGKQLNIVHRDISPQNILISFQGEVKISDFGIAKARSEPSLTQAGVIKGKLSYMSPEQALGQSVDLRADIYALGIVFYEILSGEKLYQFGSDIEAIRFIPEKEIAPIIKLRPDIPDELNRIVMKCLEKDKELRYQSVQELHDDLIHLKMKLNITYDRSNLVEFMEKHFKK